jgi:diguanylate cyclase
MSSDDERHNRTLLLAEMALQQIKTLKLPADPQSFELWYLYASNLNLKLNETVNELLRRQGNLTEADLVSLYEEHISAVRSAGRLNNVANQLSGQVGQVLQMIGTASASAKQYDHSLGAGAAAFDQNPGDESVKSIVQELIQATREMEENNHSLEVQLASAKNRADHLQREIETIRLENLTDPVTLVPNRQFFDDSITSLFRGARDGGHPLSLLMLDIDHFKKVNDKYGHQIGDFVLRAVAAKIKGLVRSDDVAARYGGEEFAVIVPKQPLAVAKLLAERIRSAIEAADIKMRSTGTSLGRVTISIGVAQLRDSEEIEDFIRRADQCLYAAKRAGRNRVVAGRNSEQEHSDKHVA